MRGGGRGEEGRLERKKERKKLYWQGKTKQKNFLTIHQFHHQVISWVIKRVSFNYYHN